MKRILLGGLIVLGAVSGSGCRKRAVVPEKLSYEIVSVIPHDADCFTQGLQIADGRLFESGGMEGQSSVREADPRTGAVLRKRNLPAEIFAEGLTLHGSDLWLITWKNKTAYLMDPANFRTRNTLSYEGEGWGLASDGANLIMSDGSDTLRFRSPKDFSVIKSVKVTDHDRPVKFLNELELADGALYANVYTTERIARIDPSSGSVTGWLDLSGLKGQLPQPNRARELNGIAYDKKTGHFLVTGKYWPRMFEIRLKK